MERVVEKKNETILVVHPCNPPSPIEEMYKNAVYYPNFRIHEGKFPSRLDAQSISHIFYSYARIRSDGHIESSDPIADTQLNIEGQLGGFRACTALKNLNKDLKVILCLGNRNDARPRYIRVVGDPNKRRTFVREAANLVRNFQLDGISIEWNNPQSPAECCGYFKLLQELRAELPAPTYSLAATLSSGRNTSLDLGAIEHLLDLVNVECYDFYGPWSSYAGHHAQLELPTCATSSTEGAMTGRIAIQQVVQQGVPRQKIMMGIPTHGRCFPKARREGDVFEPEQEQEGTIEYNNLPPKGNYFQTDDHAAACYCVDEKVGFISFDNPSSIRLKAEFVRRNGLGGFYFSDGTSDYHKEDHRNLIMAGHKELNN